MARSSQKGRSANIFNILQPMMKIAYDIMILPYQQLQNSLYLIKIQPMIILLLIFLIHTASTALTLPFSTTQMAKHGSTFETTPCNANTVIDFAFSSNQNLTPAADATFSASSSSLTYLDILGYEQTYTLKKAQSIAQTFLTGFSKAFLFQFVSGNNRVFVAIPFVDANGNGVQSQQTINIATQTDPKLSGLSSLQSSTTKLPLSYFNYLNDLNYNSFYSIMDTSQMVTLLIAKIHFRFQPTITTSATQSIFAEGMYSFNTEQTGDVLCWGSQFSYGFFQTHMRESVPLWTMLIFVLFFWLFNLLSAEVTPQVYQRSFVNNKWTSWSIYSLFWLCHQQWFTRTSRSSLLLINFIWQCLIVSAIYYHQGKQVGSPIIIWAAVVAYTASIPMPYILGKAFFQRIYKIQLQKFQAKYKMRTQTDKAKHEQLQKSAILMQEHIAGIYYFYYSMCIIIFIVFSILCVHLMHQFPRDYYYLNWHWLGSALIALGIDHLVVDPIFTCLFGGSSWYQARGYYYNCQLGELARKVD